MDNVVVGLEDDPAGQIAVEWVIERARSTPLRIRLVAVLDALASNPLAGQDLLGSAARRIQQQAPESVVETMLADRPRFNEFIDQSRSADLMVIGTEPDPRIQESRVESFPVSLAARSDYPVVVVPTDWKGRGGAIVVGVESEADSDEAALFAAREAVTSGRELVIVHTWEPWAARRTRSAHILHAAILEGTVGRVRTAFPAVQARGVLVEAVAHEGIIANSLGASLIVLGTHRLGKATGVVLGRIHKEVMQRGGVPLCSVPLVSS